MKRLMTLSVVGLLVAVLLVFCSCVKVEKGAFEFTFNTTVELDEVRGITMANAQQEVERE